MDTSTLALFTATRASVDSKALMQALAKGQPIPESEKWPFARTVAAMLDELLMPWNHGALRDSAQAIATTEGFERWDRNKATDPDHMLVNVAHAAGLMGEKHSSFGATVVRLAENDNELMTDGRKPSGRPVVWLRPEHGGAAANGDVEHHRLQYRSTPGYPRNIGDIIWDRLNFALNKGRPVWVYKVAVPVGGTHKAREVVFVTLKRESTKQSSVSGQ